MDEQTSGLVDELIPDIDSGFFVNNSVHGISSFYKNIVVYIPPKCQIDIKVVVYIYFSKVLDRFQSRCIYIPPKCKTNSRVAVYINHQIARQIAEQLYKYTSKVLDRQQRSCIYIPPNCQTDSRVAVYIYTSKVLDRQQSICVYIPPKCQTDSRVAEYLCIYTSKCQTDSRVSVYIYLQSARQIAEQLCIYTSKVLDRQQSSCETEQSVENRSLPLCRKEHTPRRKKINFKKSDSEYQ